MEGIEKLEVEVADMNNTSISVIWDYLKTRTDLYEKFNNAEKSIKQMYEFIYEKAKKQKNGNVAVIMDNVVFLWAVSYFSKSNEELGLNEKKVMPPKPAETIKKIEEKEKQEEKVVEEKKDEQINLFQEVQG